MSSVFSSTDSVGAEPSVCPNAAKLSNAQANEVAAILKGGSKVNGEAMLNGHKLSMNGSAQANEDSAGHKAQNGRVNGNEGENNLEKAAAGVEERQWIRPDLPSKCTWKLGGSSVESPHCHSEL